MTERLKTRRNSLDIIDGPSDDAEFDNIINDFNAHTAAPNPHSNSLAKTGGTMTGTLTLNPSSGTALSATSGNVEVSNGNIVLNGDVVINDADDSNTYSVKGGALTANVNVNLPDLAANDVFTTNAATQTLTNKTLNAPVLGGSVTGTYTLAGTPTISSPTINTPTLSGDVAGTYTLSNAVTLSDSPATPVNNNIYRESIIKAWVRYVVGTGVVASYNVASVSNLSTGKWRVNYTTSPGTAFACVATAGGSSTPREASFDGITSTYVEVMTATASGTLTDYDFNVYVVGE